MEEPPAKETPEQGLNKIDLSQLQDFRFGTQWTEVKSVPGPRREREREREPRREGPERGEGRSRGPAGADPRRDRRGFRRPVGSPGDPAPAEDAGRSGPGRDAGGLPPREWRRREGPREGRGPPREGGGERRWSGSRPPMEPRPYQSPFFNVAFYPEDAGFTALVKAMRASCRTFELFEIARLILGKYDRFVVVLTRRPPETPAPEAAPAAAEPPGAAEMLDAAPRPAAPPPRSGGPLYVSLPDGVPHETEAAALAHVVGRHLDKFFDLAEVEVEPPKGTFPFVNRCTLSGELLGPPNYHRYAQIVQQHHAQRFPRMPFDRFRENIETVRDPEAVNQWLDKMKHVTRYTWKPAAEGEQPVVFDDFDDARAHLIAAAKGRMVKTVESARFHAKAIESLPPGEIRRAIDGQLERQRRFPLDTANALRGRLRREGFTIFKKGAKGISYVCAVKRKFRVPGQSFAQGINTLITFLEVNPMITVKELPVKLLGITPPSTASTAPMPLSMSTPPVPAPAAAVESPAPVAEATPLAPSGVEGPAPSPVAGPALSAIEGPAAEPVAPAAAVEAPAPSPGAAESPAPTPPAAPAAESTPAAPPAPSKVEGPALSPVEGPLAAVESTPVAPAPLTPEEQERLRRLTMDLRWLVTEGYVTEFADGRLFAPPPIAEARPKGAEADDVEEHDLESFPEAPPAPAPSSDSVPPTADTAPEASPPALPGRRSLSEGGSSVEGPALSSVVGPPVPAEPPAPVDDSPAAPVPIEAPGEPTPQADSNSVISDPALPPDGSSRREQAGPS